MRTAFMALFVPATLASGGVLSAAAQEAETPPAAETEVEQEAATEGVGKATAEGAQLDVVPDAAANTAIKATPAPVSANAISGAWSSAANSVTFTGLDGAAIVTFSCRNSDEGNTVALRMPASGSASVEQIAVFGGAGAGVMVAEETGENGVISGRFDPWGRIGTVLATGLGEVKIMSGDSAVIVPNSEVVERLVESCQPPLPTVAERLAAMEAAKEMTNNEGGEDAGDSDA